MGAVTWNPKESNLLLSGSYDRTVAVIDVRTPQAGKKNEIKHEIFLMIRDECDVDVMYMDVWMDLDVDEYES